jgi:hypothetical protein
MRVAVRAREQLAVFGIGEHVRHHRPSRQIITAGRQKYGAARISCTGRVTRGSAPMTVGGSLQIGRVDPAKPVLVLATKFCSNRFCCHPCGTAGFRVQHPVRDFLNAGSHTTANPTAEWIARQITEAFPWEEAPRYLIRYCERRLVQPSHVGCGPWAFAIGRQCYVRRGRSCPLARADCWAHRIGFVAWWLGSLIVNAFVRIIGSAAVDVRESDNHAVAPSAWTGIWLFARTIRRT